MVLLEQVDLDNVSLEDFEFGPKLGSGSFGQVFKTKFKLNQKSYALKMLDKRFIEKVSKFSGLQFERIKNKRTCLEKRKF